MVEERRCINIYSNMNPWMDVIILVSDSDLEKAKEIAAKVWYDPEITDSDITFGDLVCLELEEANIDYEIYFKNEEEE